MTSFMLAAGGYTALVDTFSATLCSLEYEGRPLVVAHTPGVANVDYRGVVCAPWPNRLADGQYRFGGRHYQVPVNEPEKATALHGLGVFRDWEVLSNSKSEVVLALRLGSDAGYPFSVRVEARYMVSRDGLRAEIRGVNEGQTAAPYGSCPHPYLVAGSGCVNDWTLELEADHYLSVFPQRMLPTALTPTAEGPFDFRSGRGIEQMPIDNAFTGVAASSRGRCIARLTACDGHGALLSWDPRAKWVQIYTGDHLRGNPRGGLAVEPMDCPPDAFNSGEDLVVLAPGVEHSLSWALEAF